MKGKLAKNTKEHYTLGEIERAIRYEGLMRSYAERGDMDSVILLVDAERAVSLAEPTAIQEQAIQMVWRENRSLVEVGRELGVTPQAVKFNLDLFKVKLKRVLDSWKRKDVRDAYRQGVNI